MAHRTEVSSNRDYLLSGAHKVRQLPATLEARGKPGP